MLLPVPICLTNDSVNSGPVRTRQGRRSAHGRHRFSRPLLDVLEDRTLLSVDLVTNTNDSGSGSLRAAISGANPDDTIEFASGVTGTIKLTSGDLDMDQNLNIEGPGAGNLTISGNGKNQVFFVNQYVTATIAGLTIADGYTTEYGAGIENFGLLNVSNCTLSGSNSTFEGGGIANEDTGALNVINSTLSGNSAIAGGAILNDGTLTVTNSTFSTNSAQDEGGCIFNNGSANVTNSTLVGNSAVSIGGGIDANSGTTTLANTIIAGNSANSGADVDGPVNSLGYNLIGNSSYGSGFVATDQLNVNPLLGPLQNNGGPTETMALLPGSPAIDSGSDSLIPSGVTTDQRGDPRDVNGVDIGAFEVQVYTVYSTADSGGGSLRAALTNANQDGSSVIDITTGGVITLASLLPAISSDVQIFGPGASNLTVSGNGAYQVFNVNAGVTATIAGLTIADGYTQLGGGAIFNDGTLTLTSATLSDNSAQVGIGGGGICNGGTLTIIDSTLSDNSASRGGGGVLNTSESVLTVTNSTFSGNSAGVGGGIDNFGMLTVTDSTLSNDGAAFDGGGFDTSMGTTTLANTIIAGNTATTGPDVNGTVDSLGFNLIGNTSGSSGFAATDLHNVNPLLGPLQNNGGPTETMALLPGSPAIAAGSVALIPTGIITDQRGSQRVVSGTVDIGAFELRGFIITASSGNNQQTTVGTTFAAPLVVTVRSPFGEPIAGGVVTYISPSSGASATFPGGTGSAAIGPSGQASIAVAANTIAGGYAVAASAGVNVTTNFSLTNTPGPADNLEFVQQPTDTTYGDTISPPVTVEVTDQYNNPVNSTASITISLGTNPTGASLGGTLLESAVAGTATFEDLTISKAGMAYALAATSPGLNAAPPSDSFNIKQRPISVSATANTKTYDGTASAAAMPTITAGSLAPGDTADFIETYSTRNVGTGLTLTPGGTVDDGNDGDNYSYHFVSVSTGVITAEPLTITALANTKTYDATTSAAAVPAITSDSLGVGDTPRFTEVYGTQNVGTSLTLTPSGTVDDGNDGHNYTYRFVPVSTGVITPAPLTITAVTNTKVYDGTTSATAIPTDSGLQGTDSVTNLSETYDTRNAGTNKTLSVATYTVNDGNGGNNYMVTTVPNQTGVITRDALTITAVANTKTYDATTSAAAMPAITSGSLQGMDTANFVETYSTKNAGTGLTLTPSGTVTDGNGGNNYTYTFVPVSTGVITTAPLTITAVTNTKFYDGTTSAAAIPTVSGLKGTDTVTNLSETYDTSAVGTGKTLSVATYTINDGNGGNNYMVTTVANHTGVILQQTPTQLVIHTEPSATATAGQFFPTQPVIYVEDQNGNVVTGDDTTQVTVSLRVGTGPLLGTTTITASGGIATFTNLQDDTAETIILLFTAQNLVKAQSNPITVKPAPDSMLATGGVIGSVGAQARDGHKAKAHRPKPKVAPPASRHRATATTDRARSVARQDIVLNHVLASMNGNLRARVITERLADSPLR